MEGNAWDVFWGVNAVLDDNNANKLGSSEFFPSQFLDCSMSADTGSSTLDIAASAFASSVVVLLALLVIVAIKILIVLLRIEARVEYMETWDAFLREMWNSCASLRPVLHPDYKQD